MLIRDEKINSPFLFGTYENESFQNQEKRKLVGILFGPHDIGIKSRRDQETTQKGRDDCQKGASL